MRAEQAQPGTFDERGAVLIHCASSPVHRQNIAMLQFCGVKMAQLMLNLTSDFLKCINSLLEISRGESCRSLRTLTEEPVILLVLQQDIAHQLVTTLCTLGVLRAEEKPGKKVPPKLRVLTKDIWVSTHLLALRGKPQLCLQEVAFHLHEVSVVMSSLTEALFFPLR